VPATVPASQIDPPETEPAAPGAHGS